MPDSEGAVPMEEEPSDDGGLSEDGGSSEDGAMEGEGEDQGLDHVAGKSVRCPLPAVGCWLMGGGPTSHRVPSIGCSGVCAEALRHAAM
jgi:hypothetical protein